MADPIDSPAVGKYTIQKSVRQPEHTNGGEPLLRLPPWLRRPLPRGRTFTDTRSLVGDLRLNTVCQGAKCPNIHECFSAGTATFLILGSICTRNCAFCNIEPGKPGAPEADEPARVAEAAAALGLTHVVITSVTRDDLDDGGASHFAATIREVRNALPASSLEVLIPDFKGSLKALNLVISEKPDVINHNVETHGALYGAIRPQADYGQSLELLLRVHAAGIKAKSGFMVGLGESDAQVYEVLRDLKQTGCDIVTIGQYMRPSIKHPSVKRYVHPDTFAEYREWGEKLGISHVFSSPLVRSSYHAKDTLTAVGRS